MKNRLKVCIFSLSLIAVSIVCLTSFSKEGLSQPDHRSIPFVTAPRAVPFHGERTHAMNHRPQPHLADILPDRTGLLSRSQKIPPPGFCRTSGGVSRSLSAVGKRDLRTMGLFATNSAQTSFLPIVIQRCCFDVSCTFKSYDDGTKPCPC